MFTGPQAQMTDAKWGNLPWKGKNPMMVKQDDPEAVQPHPLNNVNVKIYELIDPEQRKEFEKTLTAVHNKQMYNQAEISKLEYEYCETNKSWTVLLVWVEYYVVSPEEAKNVINQDIGARS